MNRAYLCFINPYEHPSIFLTNVNLSHGYHSVIRVTSCLNFVILSEAKDLWAKKLTSTKHDKARAMPSIILHVASPLLSCLNFIILSEAKDLSRWLKIFPALSKDRPYPTMQTNQNML